jgi:hypothetical protein
MAPIIEVSDEYLNELNSSKYNRRFDLEEKTVKKYFENEKNSLYFTIPNYNGEFKAANGQKENDGCCFYKINFSENPSLGKLSFISGNDKRAINRVDSHLKIACEIQNLNDDMLEHANRIKQIDSGEAYLEGGLWRITKKAKIKLL